MQEAERVLLLVSSAVEGFLIRHAFLAEHPANTALALFQSVQSPREAVPSPSTAVRRQPSYRYPPLLVADLPVSLGETMRLRRFKTLRRHMYPGCGYVLYDQ